MSRPADDLCRTRMPNPSDFDEHLVLLLVQLAAAIVAALTIYEHARRPW